MHLAYCATYMPDFKAISYFNEGLANALHDKATRNNKAFTVCAPALKRNKFKVADEHYVDSQGNAFLFENFSLPQQLHRLGVDIAIFPNNRIPAFSHGKFKKAVIVHDLLFWRFPKKYSPVVWNFRNANLRNAIERADYVFTVSQFTANELRAFGCKKPIIVTGEGIPCTHQNLMPDPIIINQTRQEYGILGPYFLFLGTTSFQRDLNMLINAFRKVALLNADYLLVIAGNASKYKTDWLQLLKTEKILADRIIYAGAVDELTKAALIKGADALILPSTYEGFGMQMLEAFYHQTPVIASNKGALPEVAGDAAYLVEHNTEALAQAMMSVIAYPNIRRMLIEHGQERLLLYNWERAANTIWEALI